MEEILARIWENLIGRADGPLTLRLILQPAMAILLAIKAGIGDAREGSPSFLIGVITDRDHRHDLLMDAVSGIGKIFVMAFVLDIIYQLIVRRWVYIFETFLTAIILAIVPYIIVRGPANRIARSFFKGQEIKEPAEQID